MEMYDKKEIIGTAKKLIRDWIDEFCSNVDSPYVCGMASTEEGYKQLEQFILQRMALGDSVADAVYLQERILDPNRLVD